MTHLTQFGIGLASLLMLGGGVLALALFAL
jgi:hypothetical protein